MRIALKVMVAALAVLAAGATCARDLVWDGRTLLDVGLQLGADSTLVFPEPVEYSAENDAAFELAESTTDARIMTVRPKALQEQRVTFIGTRSKTVYLARFSTRASYSPIYRIRGKVELEATQAAASAQLSPTSLLRLMMAGAPANGVSVRKQAQDLVVGPEYRIGSLEMWQTPGMTGIVGTVTLLPQVAAATVRPSDITLKIPALGQLRMMGADRWDLQPDLRSATVYFVFTQ